jgi:hypothetical protein
METATKDFSDSQTGGLRKSNMAIRDDIKIIFDHWNKYKGRWKWKSHREITYDIKCAIKDALKHYKVSQICEAIDNYALILLNKEYQWTYAWPLALFLTRHRSDDRKILQWTRFLGNNFIADDYLTKEAIKIRIENRKRIEQQKETLRQKEDEKKFVPASEEFKKKCQQELHNKLYPPQKNKSVVSPEEFERRKQEQIKKLADKMKA